MSTPGPQLRDIHLPHPAWWPPAPGWWVLLLLVVIAAVGIAIFRHRHRHRVRPWKSARRELDALVSRHARDRDDAALAAGSSRLLRRIALLIEPAAAATEGAAWRVFLERLAPGTFNSAQFDALIDAPYRAHASFDADALLASTRTWCERALRTKKQRGRRGAMQGHISRVRNAFMSHATSTER